MHESGTYVSFTDALAPHCSPDKQLNTQFSGCSDRRDKLSLHQEQEKGVMRHQHFRKFAIGFAVLLSWSGAAAWVLTGHGKLPPDFDPLRTSSIDKVS